MYHKNLHRFSLFTACCTGVLIFIGGLVTSTNSGLSVPDWPTTFGENMFTYPIHKWVGGVQYEHGHRLFASFVGFLTVVLTILMWKFERRKWVRTLTYFALFAVILQGVLGGVTVLLKLPPIISIAHGMLAQSFFCIVSCLALFTSRWWIEKSSTIQKPKNLILFKLSLFSASVVFIQLFFGALMRHTYSGLAIPDFPLSYNQFFPSLMQEDLLHYNQQLVALGIKHPGDRPIMAYQIIVHLIHRSWAYIVTALLAFFGFRISKSNLGEAIQFFGMSIIGLVFAQFFLGILTVVSQKIVVVTTAHVFIGALTLMATILLALMLGKISFDNGEQS